MDTFWEDVANLRGVVCEDGTTYMANTTAVCVVCVGGFPEGTAGVVMKRTGGTWFMLGIHWSVLNMGRETFKIDRADVYELDNVALVTNLTHATLTGTILNTPRRRRFVETMLILFSN